MTGERKRTPKVRTGCITCKRRRLKCDEAKPCCVRCTTSRITCDGYQPIKTWLFEPKRSKTKSPPIISSTSTTTTPSSKSTTILTIPQHDLETSILFADTHPFERQAYQFFVERTTQVASKWTCPYLWQHLILQASRTNAALKDCMVAVAITDMHRTDPQLVADRSDYACEARGYYYSAVQRLGREYDACLQTLLMASATFWVFDMLNGRVGEAMVHLHALSMLMQLARQKESRCDRRLVRELDEVLHDCAGVPLLSSTKSPTHQPSKPAAQQQPSLPPPPAASGHPTTNGVLPPHQHQHPPTTALTQNPPPPPFPTPSHARASLARLSWSLCIALSRTPLSTRHPVRPSTASSTTTSAPLPLPALATLIFPPDTTTTPMLLDFSNPPHSTLPQCRHLTSLWKARLAATPDDVIAHEERRVLELHGDLLCLHWHRRPEDKEAMLSAVLKQTEALLDQTANGAVGGTAAARRELVKNQTSDGRVLRKEEEEEEEEDGEGGMKRWVEADGVGVGVGDKVMTSLRAIPGVVLRHTKVGKTREVAMGLMGRVWKVEAAEGRGTVRVRPLFMSFI